MHVQQLYSARKNEAEAVAEIKRTCKVARPTLLIYFATSTLDAAKVAGHMHASFLGTATLGCTTAGEIVSGKMLNNSLVAMAFDDALIADASVAMAENVQNNQGLDGACHAMAASFGAPALRNLVPEQYVGMVLIDGLSGCEERVNERLGDVSNIAFVGGSAGDALAFNKTFVMVGEHAQTNACALALIKPSGKFGIIKTQSFKARTTELIPTQIRPGTREVLRFNHKPAIEAYAEALGVPISKLAQNFLRHPVGLVTDTGLFVRSPRQIEGDAIAFYCAMHEGTPLKLLDTTDIVADTLAALRRQEQEMGRLDAIINFNCILRTVELMQDKRTQAYADIFLAWPTVGFSTYGESYIGHMNHTATLLALRQA